MRNDIIHGWLEIDREGGVIRFHNLDGSIGLWICQLPTPIPCLRLDITGVKHTSWDKKID